jgi:sporulation protein YlmC with PRC-barrel domain
MEFKKSFFWYLSFILVLILLFNLVCAEENETIIDNDNISFIENISLENLTVESDSLLDNQSINFTLNESIEAVLNESLEGGDLNTTLINLTLSEDVLNDTLPIDDFLYNNKTEILNETKEENMTILQKIESWMRIFADSLNFFMFSRPMIGILGTRSSGSSFSAIIHSQVFYGSTKGAIGGVYSANIGFYGNAIQDFGLGINFYEIYPKTAYNGSIIRLRMGALNHDSIWIVIRTPFGVNETYYDNVSEIYYIANSTGRYNIEFRVNNSIGKYTTIYDYFDIISEAPPKNDSEPTRDSGSSGGGGSSSCSSVWECGAWSYCEFGIQQRICQDRNNCPSSPRPEEERVCIDSLFDVSLNFENLTLSKDKELEFYVKLLETRSGFKTDVTLEYTIVDEKGNVIYKSSDTKAVEGFMFFKKAISDLAFKPGFYKLNIKIIYGNLRTASASQKFEITSEDEIKIGDLLDGSDSEMFNISPRFINVIIYLFIFVIILLLVIFIVRFLGRLISKIKKKNLLTSQFGKKVYSEDGKFIGKIKEVMLIDHRIYGWIVAVDKTFFNFKKPVLIKTRHIFSIGDVIIVNNEIFDAFLNKKEHKDGVYKTTRRHKGVNKKNAFLQDHDYLDL